jgi:hypothetical protein
MVNSLIEWYRPRGPAAAEELADTAVTVAFDGLRVRPPDLPPAGLTLQALRQDGYPIRTADKCTYRDGEADDGDSTDSRD